MNSTTDSSQICGDQICRDVLFEGLPGPVRLVLPEKEMEEAFSQYAFWPHACVSPVGESGEPLLLLRLQGENEDFPANIEVDGDGPYVLEKDPTLDLGVRREESLAAGLCSLNIAMVTHLCRSRGLLCLHGALLGPASEGADAGLLLLGNNRAGKSTLTVRLIPSIQVVYWAYPLTWTISSVLFVLFLSRLRFPPMEGEGHSESVGSAAP